MICDLYPKPYTLNPKQGFTLIELLVVIAIIGLLTAAVIPAFSGFAKRQTLYQATKDLKTDLRSAQNKAVSGVDGLLWGVHFVEDTSVYNVFSTDDSHVYSPGKVKELASIVSIDTVSPNDGDTPRKANVVFNRFNGEAGFYNDAGGTLAGPSITITLALSGSTLTRNVIVERGGKIYELEP